MSTPYAVLSRVTLGADIKITSMMLDAMKRRFPDARIVFVAGRKSIELFEADKRLEFCGQHTADGLSAPRIAFGIELQTRLTTPNSIVVDPDSRMTQLGLIGDYFHFPSRTEGSSTDNANDLAAAQQNRTFGVLHGWRTSLPRPLRWIANAPPRQSVSA